MAKAYWMYFFNLQAVKEIVEETLQISITEVYILYIIKFNNEL